MDYPVEDWDEVATKPKFQLRGRQQEWVDAIERDWATHSRLLAVAPGGVGKTGCMGVLAANAHARGKKTLVLANRDRLTRQTARRIQGETGIEVDVEMASSHASPFAPIVVGSVQTLSRENRLTGFADDHFGYVIPDECHMSMAVTWVRILNYFHYGAQSLAPDWVAPPDGTYEPKALICGFTATPDIGERRSLMELYQKRSVNYSYLEAVREGWLVQPVQKSVPVRIDIRKFKATSTPIGMDFNATELGKVMVPVIEELAQQILTYASDRKTMCFLPSVECARRMVEALNRLGMQAFLAAGEHEDTDADTERFVACGPGSVLVNAQIYNFGVDFPDVDCIAWFRATLSRAFLIQGLYRGTRVLPGVLEGCVTAEERLAAIAASAKRFLLILDPLFVHERIDLLDAYDLYTDEPSVKQKMKAEGSLTPESAEKNTRDFLAALAKEARKHARKESRTIDPLIWAVTIGDQAIAHYVPETDRDRRPVTEGQAEFFRKNKIDAGSITTFGLASKIIGRYMARIDLGLATAGQLSFLKQLGLPDEDCMKLTQREAGATIDRILKEKNR